jgi:hypothetical protein
MTKRHLTPDDMRQLLEYCPSTGKLFWRARDEHWFAGDEALRRRICKLWNHSFAGVEALTAPDGGYLSGNCLGRKMLAHRAAWAVYYGAWPEHTIDHINGIRDDNRIVNLRDVTRSQNQRNLRRDRRNTSGTTGVCFDAHNGFWVARISVDGGRVFLGAFSDLSDAVAARKAAEVRVGYARSHGSTTRPSYVHPRDRAR